MSEKRESSYVVFLASPSGKILTWNAPCQRILGYSEHDVLLRPLTTLLTLSGKRSCQDYLREARDDSEKLEVNMRHASGQNLVLNLTFVPQYRKSGRFSGYSVILGPVPDHFSPSESETIGRTPLKKMVNLLTGTFYVINQSGHFVMWNRKVELATQFTAAEMREIHVLDLFSDEEKLLIADRVAEVFEHDGEILVEANLRSKNGATTPYIFSGSRFQSNNKFYLCGMGLDISERRQQDERLRLRERALHASSNGIVITRCEGNENPIEYVNPAFERITGYQEQEVLGRDARFLAAPGLDERERMQLRTAIRERKEISVVLRNLRKNGELFWNNLTITPVLNETGSATHFIGVINDITSVKHHTSYLEYEMNHDALTGLANRNLLWDRFEQALHVAQRNKTMVATVLVDLDNFKLINDKMGHDAGDEVLRAVARSLQKSVRESDTVARIGGDEFVLILSNQPSLRFTLRMIERVRQDMATMVVVDKTEIGVESSMGVSIFPHDGLSSVELMQAADVAMYHAKAAGRNDVHFFSADMKSASTTKTNLEASMRHALERNELFLVFQPKICLNSGKILGAEALLRWQHPEQGILLPASFLPDAEDNGLIVQFGEWVLNQTCVALQRLNALGFKNFVLSMNASYRELCQKNYAALIGEKLHHFQLPCDTLELEIKEACLIRNLPLAKAIFAELQRLGVKLTVDEFGVGLSSLSELQNLQVSHLKMSKSLINDIPYENKDSLMVKAMIGIGHSLNIDVIAEGVESSSQLDFLKMHGCDQMSGNYFSAPISLPAVEKLLQDASERSMAN